MTKLTKETARAMFEKTIKIAEGELHNLLYEEQPTAQIVDGVGWVADVYEIDGCSVVTGYKPFGDQPSKELVEKYEAAAKEIRGRWLPHVETKELLHALAVEFVHEVA